MNIAKLKYTNKETAIKDLLKKGVYVETTFMRYISKHTAQAYTQ
jgi:hypothetical protein